MDAPHNVTLNVYDLSDGLARRFSRALTGRQIDALYHTSVVVYGREWFYGGGICNDEPEETPYGTPLERIDMGTTQIDRELFEEFLEDLRSRYTIENYDIFDQNCNHFTAEVIGFLTGGSLPERIGNLPRDILSTPFGAAIRPFITRLENAITGRERGYDLRSFGGGFPMGGPPAAMQQQQQQQPQQPQQLSSDQEHPWLTPEGIVNPPVLPVVAPDHPHHNLNLTMLTETSQPILSVAGVCADSIEWLCSCRTVHGTSLLTDEEITEMHHIRDFIDAGTSHRFPPPKTYTIIAKLLKTLHDADCFHVLNVLRLLVLQPEPNLHYASSEHFVDALMARFIGDAATTSSEDTTDDNNEDDDVAMMCFLVVLNMCRWWPGLQSISARFRPTINKVLGSKASKHKSVAASLLFNIALYLPKRECEITLDICSAVVYALQQETMDDAAFTLLCCIGHLCFGNKEAVDIINCLELDLTKYRDPLHAPENIRFITSEVANILDP